MPQGIRQPMPTKPRIRVKAPSRTATDVVRLPVTPIPNVDFAPNELLDDAKASDLINVVICGMDGRGEFHLWGSLINNGESLMLVERARGMIVQCERDSGWRPRSGGEVLAFPARCRE